MNKLELKKVNTIKLNEMSINIKKILKQRNKVCLVAPNEYSHNANPMVNEAVFKKRFSDWLPIFYKQDLLEKDFDWTNVIIAGDLMACFAEARPDYQSYANSTIDLFIYSDSGLTIDVQKKTINETAHKIYFYFLKKYEGLIFAFDNSTSYINKITIVVPNKRTINIFLTTFTSSLEILQLFDLSYCQIAYNGNDIIYTPDFLYAMNNRITKPTQKYVQLYRIVQAYQRGYSMEIPRSKSKSNFEIINCTDTNKENSDKYHWNDLSTRIDEITSNPIVILNLAKNIIPKSSTKINKTKFIKTINAAYGHKLKFVHNYEPIDNKKIPYCNNIFSFKQVQFIPTINEISMKLSSYEQELKSETTKLVGDIYDQKEIITKIKSEFNQIDDIFDIFRFIYYTNLDNKEYYQYVLTYTTEYVYCVESYKLINKPPFFERDGVHINVYYDYRDPNKTPNIISYTFYTNDVAIPNNFTNKFFSNRTEYFINDKFASVNDIDTFDHILDHIREKIIDDRVYPWLYKLINDKKRKDREILFTKCEKHDLVKIPD